MSRSKKNRNLIIFGVVLLAVIAISYFAVNHKTTKQAVKSDTVTHVIKKKQPNPFQNFSKKVSTQVKGADKAVSKVINDKYKIINGDKSKRTEKILSNDYKNAIRKVKIIQGKGTATKDTREMYMSVLMFAKKTSLNSVQEARTRIHNLTSNQLRKYLMTEFEHKIIVIAAKTNHMSNNEVRSKTKPLTKQQAKARESSTRKAAATSKAKKSRAKKNSATISNSKANSSVSSVAVQSSSKQNYSSSAQSSAKQTYSASTQSNSQKIYSAPSQNTSKQTYSTPVRKSSSQTYIAPKHTFQDNNGMSNASKQGSNTGANAGTTNAAGQANSGFIY